MSYTTFGTWGKGDKGETILKYFLLTFLRSVLIFIKQCSDPMCFPSILAEKCKLY